MPFRSDVAEKFDCRAPERGGLNVREHRNAENRALQAIWAEWRPRSHFVLPYIPHPALPSRQIQSLSRRDHRPCPVISPPLPTPAQQSRVDGWSPALQRAFLETLAATGVVTQACEAVGLTARSAYNLRIHRDGAAFRLGWDAAILIARARLADDLLARALSGCTDTIRKDEDNFEVTRHRHDNRLAMSMLARLDRMADSPPEGSDAALARIVAQDFAAYCDMICPSDDATADIESLDHPEPAPEHSSSSASESLETTATALSPGASAALFIAACMALHTAAQPAQKRDVWPSQQRCELPEPIVDLMTLPPEEAVTRMRGVWWDEERAGWRTDFPAPPDCDADLRDSAQRNEDYDIDYYERDLTPQEEAAWTQIQSDLYRPFAHAAARARDAYFGFAASAHAPVTDAPVPA